MYTTIMELGPQNNRDGLSVPNSIVVVYVAQERQVATSGLPIDSHAPSLRGLPTLICRVIFWWFCNGYQGFLEVL